MIMRDRVFTTKDKSGKDLVLEFRKPSQTVLNRAELVFKKTFSNCFREGILTSAEVEKLLRARGMWNDEKELEGSVLQIKIAELESKLDDKSLDEAEARLIAEELVMLRSQLMAHNEPIVSVAENTCESVGNEERNQFLITQCIYHKKTGFRVYRSVEEFKNRAEEQAAADSYKEVMIASLEVIMGKELESDLSQIYSENRWLSKHMPKEPEIKEKSKKKKKAKKSA